MGVDDNSYVKFIESVIASAQAPLDWIRDSLVRPNQQDYVWYHRKFNRVPTIDQCYTDDIVCYEEANDQFRRDKLVDDEIVSILRRRMEECQILEGYDKDHKCASLVDDYENASTNWFSKYGDLGAYRNVKMAYMRQKHRMVWERRHGPIGGDTSVPEPIFK